MEIEVGFFEAFYAGQVQHPILLWLAAAAALVFSARARGVPPVVRRYCVLLVVVSMLDAWLTSDLIYGIGTLAGTAASTVPLLFVLAGDLRFLFLVLAGSPRGEIEVGTRTLLGALGLTVVVPIWTQLMLSVLPASLVGLDGARVMFFIYEVSFVGLTLSLLKWHSGLRANPWLVSVSRFVILYYSLWAGADLIILATGSDLGYLLRVVPNILYYGGLIAAIVWWAPRDAALVRESKTS